MNIAINGFGRIGRAAFKIILERIELGENINVVAINDLASAKALSYLLKRDTVYGTYNKEISSSDRALIIDGKKYPLFSSKDPLDLPWKDLQVDVVLECTGAFTKSEAARAHITAGARKVLLSAPAKDDGFKTAVLGEDDLDINGDLISNASCTTNCITPVIHVLSRDFGVEKALMTTIHGYTSTQELVDSPNEKDPRKGRAAAQNLIPTTTGAAIATAKAMPRFEQIFDGIAIRAPVICGSISDITAVLKKDVTVEEVNEAFKKAQNEEKFKNVLMYSEEPLVSSDIIGLPYSAIVDGLMTHVVAGNFVKVLAWYDNEWGYSNRLVDMAIILSKKG